MSVCVTEREFFEYCYCDYPIGKDNLVLIPVYQICPFKSTIIWDMPCRMFKVNRRFAGTYRLHLQGRRKSQQETSVKEMKVFETLVDIQRTTRNYIPEDGTLHNHRCEKLRS
jgi:hypothetical protein